MKGMKDITLSLWEREGDEKISPSPNGEGWAVFDRPLADSTGLWCKAAG